MSTFQARRERLTDMDILPPEPAARHARPVHRGAGAAMDADFVTLRSTASPPTGLSSHNDNRSASGVAVPAGLVRLLENGKAGLARVEQALMRLSADLFSAVVALIFVVVFGLSGGFALLGKDETPHAGPMLDITHVSLTPQQAGGMPILLINGIIENRGENLLDLPAIRAELVAEGGVLASTFIEPPVVRIEGGHSHGFSARIPHPGGKLPELKLSFAPQDASRS